MNLLRSNISQTIDAPKTKQQLANEKRQRTRERNAAAKRREVQKEFYAKRAAERRARVEQNKRDAAKKQAARVGALIKRDNLNRTDELAKIGLSDFLDDNILNSNAQNTNNPQLYKKLVKERVNDITTATDARKFVEDARNADAFMIQMKSIPKYAKIIKNYSQDKMFDEATNKFNNTIKQQRSSSYNTPEMIRDANGKTIQDNMEYMESEAFDKKGTKEKQSFANSLAASILHIPSNDHSMAATIAIAADFGWDDHRIVGHNGIRHGHNYKKNKRGRSVGTEQAIDFANTVSMIQGVDVNEAIRYAYESNT